MSALRSLLAGSGVTYTDGSEIPPQKGSYVLVVYVYDPIPVMTKYGQKVISPGLYAYVGSAFGPGGLRARVSRHFRREKKIHWHIDWITANPRSQVVGAFLFPGRAVESNLAAALSRHFASVPGFGASDSREDSHLFRICE